MRFVIAAALLGLTSASLRAQCPDGTPPPCRVTPARAQSAPAVASVAVLTFDNLSRDTADTYLVEGLANDISSQLGRLDRLTVASRSVVRRTPNIATLSPQAAARALNVAYLVTGDVQRGGARVRVSVELVRAANGQSVWSDQFDRTASDLLDVQRDVATAVATEIGGRLSPQERRAVQSQSVVSGEAYDHMLRGDFLIAQRNWRSAERAIAEFEAAIRSDPRSALAHAKLSYALLLCSDWSWPCQGQRVESLLAEGRRATDRALALDSSLALAWRDVALAASIGPSQSADSMRPAVERAVRLAPRDPAILRMYGYYFAQVGRDSAAVVQYRRELAIDPGSAVTYDLLWRLAMIGHRYDEARGLIDTAIALEPSFNTALARRAMMRASFGDSTGALADIDAAIRLDSSWAENRDGLLAYAEAVAGNVEAARARVDTAFAQRRYSEPMAAAALRTGRADAWFATIPAGTELPWFWMRFPWYDPVRSDPRFLALIDADRRRWQRP
jgi:TolB-like protein/tetratricopeptide (TPR) repeat protein